jgi:ATP-dependent Clp protease ATP-binding subunit ClpA
MFERFTNQARRVVVLAQEESRNLNHNYIGTEHLVLGLLREGGTGARALASLDVTVEAVRREVEARVGRGDQPQAGHIPFTPRAKKALELSLRESLALGQNYIGTGHLLLGLIRKGGDGVGPEIVVGLGADLNVLRARVIELMADDTEEGAVPSLPVREETVLAERHPGAIQGLLDSIDTRLTVIERHLGITRPVPDELRTYDRRIAKVIGAKEEAIERQDFERAAALRQEEKQLRSERARAQVELEEARLREGAAAESEPAPEDGGPAAEDAPGEASATGRAGEVARLQAEVARLLALLREHGIDLGKPEDPPAAAG